MIFEGGETLRAHSFGNYAALSEAPARANDLVIMD
jgi:hypothetical protein